MERALAAKNYLEASARSSVAFVDDFSRDLCGPVRQPHYFVAPALLLGRSGLLYSRRLGFLSHRFAHPRLHSHQRSSPAAQRVPGAVVEDLRLLSRSNA